MNLSYKIMASVLAAAFATRLAWRVSFEGSQAALEERFPHIDPSIVRRVHKEMVRESFRGNSPVSGEDDAAHDALFLEKVAKIYSEA